MRVQKSKYSGAVRFDALTFKYEGLNAEGMYLSTI
jgi:hypothetical protein